MVLLLMISFHAGAFATVQRAELEGRPVALKLLKPQWCNKNDRRASLYQLHFKEEATILSKIDHP